MKLTREEQMSIGAESDDLVLAETVNLTGPPIGGNGQAAQAGGTRIGGTRIGGVEVG